MIPANSLLWRMVLQECRFFKREMYMYTGSFVYVGYLRISYFVVIKNCVRAMVNWLGCTNIVVRDLYFACI